MRCSTKVGLEDVVIIKCDRLVGLKDLLFMRCNPMSVGLDILD